MRDLRIVALFAGLLGQLSAALAGVLSWALLPVTAGALIGCAVVSAMAGERTAKLVSGVASFVAVLLLLMTLPGVSLERDGLRASLGLLLVGIQVVHALTWRTARDLQTALAVAAALLVLGASFAPDILVGLPLVIGWAAVVAGVVLAAGVRSTESATIVASGGRRPPVMAATVLAVVLGLAAFLLVPASATSRGGNPLAALTNPVEEALGRGTAAYSSRVLDLRARGSLSDAPVLEVPADSPALWRSGIYPFYDGTRWTAGGRRLRTVPGPPWTLSSVPGPTRTDRARVRGVADGTVWSPGEAVGLDAAPGHGLVTDFAGTLRSSGRLRDYQVTSAQLPDDPDMLRSAPVQGRISQVWVDVPQALPPRVRALSAELTGGAPSTYDAVLAVETWLRTHATYRLDSPVPGRGEDAVDQFLFVDRTGFCEQFAAAETVLLRAAGIQARLVTGLAYGEDAGGGRRLYREKNLHAWVEVLYAGIGWVASDPTAGVSLASGGGGGSIRQRAADAVDGALQRAVSVPGGRPSLAVVLLIVALAVVVVVRMARRRISRPAPVAAAPARPEAAVGPALAAFLRYDERLGPRRRRESESLAELARRLGPEPAAALAVVADECYAPLPPDGAEEAAAHLDRLEQPTA